jgi:hypothetical protein
LDLGELIVSLIKELFIGRSTIFNGTSAFLIVMAVALGCTCDKELGLSNSGSQTNSNSESNAGGGSTDEVEERLAVATIKSTTASFAQAVSSEDFSSLYNDTADEFKERYSQKEFQETFKDFIRQKKRLYPILAKAISMEPEFTEGPSQRTENNARILSASGKYSTSPLPITFKYEYVRRGSSWKLYRLEIFVK